MSSLRIAFAPGSSGPSTPTAWPGRLLAVAALSMLACASPRSEEVLDAGAEAAAAATPASGPGGGPVAGDARGAADGPSGGAAGADAPDDIADPFVPIDGRRLKGRWAEAPGGARLWLGWYDSELGGECRFITTADGALRCVPCEGGAIGGYFQDAACTVALASTPYRSCWSGEVVRALAPPACPPAPTSIFRGGARWRGMAYYRSQATGRCERNSFDADYLLVGPELPASTFVKGVEVPRPLKDGTAKVEPVILEAEDGARGFVRWQDVASAAPCRIYQGSDGRERCPVAFHFANRYSYSDAQCQRESIYVQMANTTCAPFPQAVPLPRTDCSGSSQLFTLGAQLTQTFKKWNGACMPQDVYGGAAAYALGPPVSDDIYPAIDKVVDTAGGGRLRALWKGPPGGRRVLADALLDTTRGQPCTPLLFTDGVTRCVPPTPPLSSYFGDAACTRPLASIVGDFEQMCPPPLYTSDDETCPRRYRICALAIGNEAIYVAGDKLYRLSP